MNISSAITGWERTRRLALNVIGTGAFRLINLAMGLISVPLTINAVPLAEYGYVAVAVSIASFASFADLGLGSAIVNTVARAKSQRAAKRAVSIAWFSTGFLSLALCVLTCAAYLFASAYPSSAPITLAMLCVFSAIPAGLAQRLLFALQRSNEANAWATLGRALSFLALYVVSQHNFGETRTLLLIMSLLLVPGVVNWISLGRVFSSCEFGYLRPSWSLFARRALPPYLILGGCYLVSQALPFVEVGVDNLLVGSMKGPREAAELDVYIKLFTYVPALLSLAAFPLWPALANARAHRDNEWARNAVRVILIVILSVSTMLASTLFAFGPWLVLKWTGLPVELSAPIRAGMACFSVLTSLGSLQSMLVAGSGMVRMQAKLLLIYIVALVLLKICALAVWGITAMIWTTNLVYLFRLYSIHRLGRRILR